jgi:hypothetical protein
MFVLAVVAAVAAWTARAGLLLSAARKGRIVVDGAAPTYRLASAGGIAALMALFLAVAMAWSLVPDAAAIVIAGTAGASCGALLSRRDARPKGPRTTSPRAWLVVDTALPAGTLAALVSIAVGSGRLHAQGVVAPMETARHLAATTFAYALFLGLGGFAKAFSEKASGLVVVSASTKGRAPSPGPLLAGGVTGVLFLFIGPRVLPTLPLVDVLALKAVAGLLIGGALSYLGALQGAYSAEHGRR